MPGGGGLRRRLRARRPSPRPSNWWSVPGVPVADAADPAGHGPRRAGDRRRGTLRARGAGADLRHHRLQRQEHGHHPGGADGAARRAAGARSAAIWASRSWTCWTTRRISMCWNCPASSWRPRRACAPQAAVVLNISADHLDRYPDLAAYAAAKARVYRAAPRSPSSIAMTRGSRPWPRTGAREIGFTLGVPGGGRLRAACERDGGAWLCRGDEPLMPADEVADPGSAQSGQCPGGPGPGRGLRPAARRPAWRRCGPSRAWPIAASWWPSAGACAGTTIPRAPIRGPRWRRWMVWSTPGAAGPGRADRRRRRQGRGFRARWRRRWRAPRGPWS